MIFFRNFTILFLFRHILLINIAYNKLIKTKKTTVVFKHLFMAVGLRLTITFFSVYIYFSPFSGRHIRAGLLLHARIEKRQLTSYLKSTVFPMPYSILSSFKTKIAFIYEYTFLSY